MITIIHVAIISLSGISNLVSVKFSITSLRYLLIYLECVYGSVIAIACIVSVVYEQIPRNTEI